MTNELEKQFFDTFGIEPKEKVNQTFNGAKFKVETIKGYPEITDRILLELICILSTYEWGYHCCYIVRAHNFEKLKEIILKDCIIEYEHIKHQVRTLFEEG